MMKRFTAAVLLLLCLAGCGKKEYTAELFAMDTFMSITVQGAEAEDIAAQCGQRINALERALSRTREDSGLWQLNHADGAPVLLDADGAEAVSSALALSAQTAGRFDPTVAPLTDLWGIGTDSPRVPGIDEIAGALRLCGTQNVQLTGNTAALQNGAQLDLGGIAKGYAADQCAALLRDAGASGLLRLGGNIYAVGRNGGKDWVIGIADPDNPADYIATVGVHDLSVVTSGDYERYFEQDGRRYYHIFDPATGFPAESGLRSVTVLDESSTRADAFTTALFVMGLEDGLSFCAENHVAAVFITADRQVYATEQVLSCCTFTFVGQEKGYTYAQ